MINFFAYLREKAREAVLAGVQDALDQIDPAIGARPQAAASAAPALPPAPKPSPAPASEAKRSTESGVPPAAPAGETIQQRLARAAGAGVTELPGPPPEPPPPPGPSAPRRGRGRLPQDGE